MINGDGTVTVTFAEPIQSLDDAAMLQVITFNYGSLQSYTTPLPSGSLTQTYQLAGFPPAFTGCFIAPLPGETDIVDADGNPVDFQYTSL